MDAANTINTGGSGADSSNTLPQRPKIPQLAQKEQKKAPKVPKNSNDSTLAKVKTPAASKDTSIDPESIFKLGFLRMYTTRGLLGLKV